MIVRTLADYFNVPLLSGLQITNILYNQFLQNSFFIENKQIKQNLEIKKD